MPFSKTIGKDVTGDRYPDIPLRYEFQDSEGVVQFPLGFCPGDTSNPGDPQINFRCIGEWGIVLKEWDTVARTYPYTAKRNLNKVSKQIDADIYDDKGNKVDVSNFKNKYIEIVIGRQRHRDRSAVEFLGESGNGVRSLP